jgi:hypothetical protein
MNRAGATMARATALLACIAAAAALAPAPAGAVIDLDGYYDSVFHEDENERVPGPDAGDYAGIPINAAGRMRGDTWNSSLITVPERQCVPHSSPYGIRGIGVLHIADVRDPVGQELVRFETTITAYTAHRKIWMDGRPHPPANAPHSFQGFSTGAWEGDVLVVKTTHLKESYIRRNGLMLSDRATLTERFIRHGDILNHVMMVEDPVYLSEPMVRTTVYKAMERPAMRSNPCRPAVEIPRAKGVVPHNDLGDHAASVEYAQMYGLPLEAVRGGPETALPEFMDRFAAPTGRR